MIAGHEPMDYDEAIDWLYGTQLFGMKLGLESVSALLDQLGLPAEGQKFVHVAGTNGKGSVCAMADSVLREAGYKVGLFTSPHLVSYRERMLVNGEMVAEAQMAAGLTAIRDLVADWKVHPTFFELTLALALRVFSEESVDVVVLETGMGGRLDATNVVTPEVAVITPVGLDHTQWLGETLPEIAGEKAGIIKPGIPAVTAPQEVEAMAVLEERAQACGVELVEVNSCYDGEVGLAGEHQQMNAAVVVASLKAGGFEVSKASIAKGLRTVKWRARFQRVGERLVVDGAHNPAAARATVATWKQLFGEERAAIIFGAVESKDIRGVLALLEGIAGRWVITTVNSVRGLSPERLALEIDGEVRVAENVEQALEMTRDDDRVLVCGSLFLAGEVLGLVEGSEFESSSQ